MIVHFLCTLTDSDVRVRSSHSVVSDSLRPHGLQHESLPCPSSTPGVYSNSCPLRRWCHPTISSSVVPFSSCFQIFPSIKVFSNEAVLHQRTGASVSASVLPMNTQDWSPLGWTGCFSLQSKGLSRVSSNTTTQKHQFFGTSIPYSPTLTSIHDYWKNHSLD